MARSRRPKRTPVDVQVGNLVIEVKARPQGARQLLDGLWQIATLGRHDIAIGGVLGALHHVESLDIVGTTTLPLTLHDPDGTASSAFVERLDPALARTESREETPLVVVHRQRTQRFLATDEEAGAPWADPAECLLDLHEAGLEGLAEQFRSALVRRRTVN